MTRRSESFGANAVAQVLRGATQALTTSALPLVCAPFFGPRQYQVWVLVTGLALLVTYADFGLQASVGASVSRLLAAEQAGDAKQLVRAVVVVLAAGGTIIILFAWAAGQLLPIVYRDLPPGLLSEAQVGLIILAVGLWLNVATAITLSWFAARRQTPRIVAVIAPMRLAAAVALGVTAWVSGSLVACAITVAVGALVTSMVAFAIFERDMGMSSSVGLPAARRQLGTLRQQTGAVAVWSITTALVASLDTSIVGVVDFETIAPYGVAIAVVAGTSGLLFSLHSPLTAWFASAAQEAPEAGMGLVRQATRVNVQLLLCGLAVVLAVLSVLDPGRVLPNADGSRGFVAVLMVGLVVRLSLNPLCLYLLVTGASRPLWIPQVVEGILNLSLSFVLGYQLGAMGVALATVLASVVGALLLLRYGMRAINSAPRPSRFARSELIGPALPGIGLCALAAVGLVAESLSRWSACAGILGAVWMLARCASELRSIRAAA
jgi:Na+-driven multidrug efflux pump